MRISVTASSGRGLRIFCSDTSLGPQGTCHGVSTAAHDAPSPTKAPERHGATAQAFFSPLKDFRSSDMSSACSRSQIRSRFPRDEVSDEKPDPEGGHGDEGGVVVRVSRDVLGSLSDLLARGLHVVAGAVGDTLGIESEPLGGFLATRDHVVKILFYFFAELLGFASGLLCLVLDLWAVNVFHLSPPASEGCNGCAMTRLERPGRRSCSS